MRKILRFYYNDDDSAADSFDVTNYYKVEMTGSNYDLFDADAIDSLLGRIGIMYGRGSELDFDLIR